MNAQDKNDIVSHSSNYSHILPHDVTFSLDEYADAIENNYKASDKNRTATVCVWLRGTEGTIITNRHGTTFLRWKKHKD